MNNKRYQELGTPYRIALWLRWMPIGYIKAFGWYFIKKLRWEDICDDICDDIYDDDEGRVSLSTCIGICVGMNQYDMRWYYTSEEAFGDGGELIIKNVKTNFLEKIGVFLENKLIEIVDGKIRF